MKNTRPGSNIVKVAIDPVTLLSNETYRIYVTIWGKGFSDLGIWLFEEVAVDGLDENGKFVRKVTFKFNKGNCDGQIPEIYFRVKPAMTNIVRNRHLFVFILI